MVDVKDSVATTSILYNSMYRDWGMIDTLYAGTQAMRDASTTYLPKEPMEEDVAYENRLARSFLFNAFSDTIHKITSKPFSKPIIIESVPEGLEVLEDDADGIKSSITQFMKEIFLAGLKYGLCHTLVDFPNTAGKVETRADEVKLGVRPKAIKVLPTQLIGWRVEDGVLTQIRIKETKIEPDGVYGDKEVDYIRVYTPLEWVLYRIDGKDDIEVDSGKNSLGKIPLVTFYANKTGYLQAESPFIELAWLNIAHWQSLSDQRNILRFARTGTLFLKGFKEEEVKNKIAIGPHGVIWTSNENADAKILEYTGKAIQAGEEDLKRLEEKMTVLGLKPLVQRSGNVTATEKQIDEADVHTDAQAWVRGGQDFLYDVYTYAAEWEKTTLPEDFRADINNDFGISPRIKEDVNTFLKMREKGDISRKTLYVELNRRGMLHEGFDYEEEEERLEEEGPKLEFIGKEEEGEGEEGEEGEGEE